MIKKNIIIITLLLSILFVLLWFLDSDKYEAINDIDQNSKEGIDENLNDLSQKYKKAKELGRDDEVEELEDKILESLPEKIRTAAKLAKQASFDIQFYGKVVDQNGKPVSGAKLEYSTIGLWNLTQGTQGEVKTDSEGVFVINAAGNKLFINMPRHPNIADAYVQTIVNGEFLDLPNKQLIFEAGQGLYSSSQGWGSYTEDNPYVISVWKVSKFEKILHKRINLLLKPDGSTFTLLKEDKYGKISSKKGSFPEGYLLFTCVRDENAFANKNGAWQATIEAIDGGIRETQDSILYEAPLSGYQSSIVESMDEGQNYGTSELNNKKYYFTAHSNQVYGSFVVDYHPYSKKRGCIFGVEYKINPNGSRNLAVPSQEPKI